MRKRLKAQTSARRKQGVSACVEIMDDELEEVLDTQIDDIERRIENVIAQVVDTCRQGEPTAINPGNRSGLGCDAGCRIARTGPDDVRRSRRNDRPGKRSK